MKIIDCSGRTMTLKFWKPVLEKAEIDFNAAYEKGLNLGKYDVAQRLFSESARLYAEGGDHSKAMLANALEAFTGALCTSRNSQSWRHAADVIQPLGNIEIRVPTPTKASDLSKECLLISSELEAQNIQDLNQKAESLENVGRNYLSLGNTKLIVSAHIDRLDLTGMTKANLLAANADALRGDALIQIDPKKASEYYQKAAIRLKTIGESVRSSEWEEKVRLASEPAECWFCGREVYGRDIHFVSMKSIITPYQQQHMSDSTLRSAYPPNAVAACKACHSAITIAADDIAKEYYNILKRELDDFRKHMEQELSSIRREISSLRLR